MTLDMQWIGIHRVIMILYIWAHKTSFWRVWNFWYCKKGCGPLIKLFKVIQYNYLIVVCSILTYIKTDFRNNIYTVISTISSNPRLHEYIFRSQIQNQIVLSFTKHLVIVCYISWKNYISTWKELHLPTEPFLPKKVIYTTGNQRWILPSCTVSGKI